MSSDIAIKVTNLGKCYEIYDKPSDRLKQMLSSGNKKYFREFWALKNVSFEIKKGETLGVIGRNGSGKSTLLQIISGTLNKTEGSVQVHGKVAALLELGAGFNPEFTGRENLFMAASLYGLSKLDVEQRLDKIIAFADIGDHLDQPVKSYSSGMFVRLAFAVIAHVDADILIVDEALAVGDAFFNQKCMRFIRGFKANGGTLLFVSHDTSAVLAICDAAVLLFPGNSQRALKGSAELICKQYLNDIYEDADRKEIVKQKEITFESFQLDSSTKPIRFFESSEQKKNVYNVSIFRLDAESFGTGDATIIGARFANELDETINSLVGGDAVKFILTAVANKNLNFPAFGLMFKDRLGQYIYTEGTDLLFREELLAIVKGETVDVVFHFKMPILIRGDYTINLAVAEGLGDDHVQLHWIHDALKLESISGPLVHGVCGFNDSKINIKIYDNGSKV